MNSPEFVIYIPGVGDLPEEQTQIPELWKPFGLDTQIQYINWAGSDYVEKLEDIGDNILRQTKLGRVSLVGASGGGKTALNLFAKHSDIIHRVVTISSKVNPYRISDATRLAYPNLDISSELLPSYLRRISISMRKRILCIYPTSDEVVGPEDAKLAGANHLEIQADGHINGIRTAITIYPENMADFIQKD